VISPGELERLAARWEAEADRMTAAAGAERHPTALARGFAHAARYRGCAQELRQLITAAPRGAEIAQDAPGHAGIPGSGPQAVSGDRGAVQTSPAAVGGC